MKTTDKTPVVSKAILLPFILITSLFALWGFANAVTDPMVQAFKKVLELSNSQAAWVQMAFYGGYFCMALPAALFVRKYSYKKGIIMIGDTIDDILSATRAGVKSIGIISSDGKEFTNASKIFCEHGAGIILNNVNDLNIFVRRSFSAHLWSWMNDSARFI